MVITPKKNTEFPVENLNAGEKSSAKRNRDLWRCKGISVGLNEENASFDDQRTNHVASFSAALGLFEYRLKKHIIKQESSGLSYLR